MSAFEMDLIWYPRAFTIIITDYSILFLFLSEEIEENHTSGKKYYFLLKNSIVGVTT